MKKASFESAENGSKRRTDENSSGKQKRMSAAKGGRLIWKDSLARYTHCLELKFFEERHMGELIFKKYTSVLCFLLCDVHGSEITSHSFLPRYACKQHRVSQSACSLLKHEIPVTTRGRKLCDTTVYLRPRHRCLH